MLEDGHGTRAHYQRGCGCVRCRAAEAGYRASVRRRHRLGLPMLGSLVAPGEARRLLHLIRLEHYGQQTLGAMFGWGHDSRRLSRQSMIRLRTALKIRRFYRQQIAQDGPPDTPSLFGDAGASS